jgi:hypothetical protein
MTRLFSTLPPLPHPDLKEEYLAGSLLGRLDGEGNKAENMAQ